MPLRETALSIPVAETGRVGGWERVKGGREVDVLGAAKLEIWRGARALARLVAGLNIRSSQLYHGVCSVHMTMRRVLNSVGCLSGSAQDPALILSELAKYQYPSRRAVCTGRIRPLSDYRRLNLTA